MVSIMFLTDVLTKKRSNTVPRNYRDDYFYFLAKSYFDQDQFSRALKVIRGLQSGSEYYYEGLVMQV